MSTSEWVRLLANAIVVVALLLVYARVDRMIRLFEEFFRGGDMYLEHATVEMKIDEFATGDSILKVRSELEEIRAIAKDLHASIAQLRDDFAVDSDSDHNADALTPLATD